MKSKKTIKEALSEINQERLEELADTIEDSLENDIPKILQIWTPEEFEELVKKNNWSPEMEFILSNACFLNMIEDILKERGKLAEYREGKYYIDFETKAVRAYPAYLDRFCHLIEMKANGFLEEGNMEKVYMELLNDEEDEEIINSEPHILA